jgi:hypothetical protein
LYAKDGKKFHKQIAEWPEPVKDHAIKLSTTVFGIE